MLGDATTCVQELVPYSAAAAAVSSSWPTLANKQRECAIRSYTMISYCHCSTLVYQVTHLIYLESLLGTALAFGDSSLVTVVTNRTCNRKNTCPGAIAQEGCPRIHDQMTRLERPSGKARGKKRLSEVQPGS